MKDDIIKKFIEYCDNGQTPLNLQRLLKENCVQLDLDENDLLWFKNYIHRVRDIMRSEPGYHTLYAFKDGKSLTSYAIKRMYKKESHASYADWLGKLQEIGLLCRYDQEDNLKQWGKKKVYAINPAYARVTKIILTLIHKRHYAPSI